MPIGAARMARASVALRIFFEAIGAPPSRSVGHGEDPPGPLPSPCRRLAVPNWLQLSAYSRRTAARTGGVGQDRGVLLADLVDASSRVAATRSRKAKLAALAEVLGRAGAGEVGPAAAFLAGQMRQ